MIERNEKTSSRYFRFINTKTWNGEYPWRKYIVVCKSVSPWEDPESDDVVMDTDWKFWAKFNAWLNNILNVDKDLLEFSVENLYSGIH